MVDNLIIQVTPVILGEGIPLFVQEEDLKRFYLKEVKKFGQFAELVYCKKTKNIIYVFVNRNLYHILIENWST